MHCLLLLFLFFSSFLPNATYSGECPDKVPYADLRVAVHYISRSRDDASAVAHLLSIAPIEQLNRTGKWQWSAPLDGLALSQPNEQCSLSKCLFILRPLIRMSSDQTMEVVHARSFELYRFPGFVPMRDIPPMFCAINYGLCGATIPLYSFSSSTNLSGQMLTTDNKKFLLDPNYRMDFGGTPICYVWSLPTVEKYSTTVATTTTFDDCSTTSESETFSVSRSINGGTTTSDDNEESTTTKGTENEIVTTERPEEETQQRKKGLKQGEVEFEGRATTSTADHEMTEPTQKTVYVVVETGGDVRNLHGSNGAPPPWPAPSLSVFLLRHWHWWVLFGAFCTLLFCSWITLATVCCCLHNVHQMRHQMQGGVMDGFAN